jgi:hypothetical protein
MERQMKKQISLWALCLLVTVLLLLPHAAQAQCTNATFSGTYQFGTANLNGSAVIAGIVTADGAGNLTMISEAGYIFPASPGALYASPVYPPASPKIPNNPTPGAPQQPFVQDINQGTYQVNPDCTMSLVFHPSEFTCYEDSPGPCAFWVHAQAVLMRGGSAFYVFATDPAIFLTGAGIQI